LTFSTAKVGFLSLCYNPFVIALRFCRRAEAFSEDVTAADWKKNGKKFCFWKKSLPLPQSKLLADSAGQGIKKERKRADSTRFRPKFTEERPGW
jgi:hypothetical protein